MHCLHVSLGDLSEGILTVMSRMSLPGAISRTILTLSLTAAEYRSTAQVIRLKDCMALCASQHLRASLYQHATEPGQHSF